MRAIWQGEKLRVRRKQLGLTMAELATYVLCDRPLISMWEDNKASPSGHYLVVLAMVLKIEPKELFITEEQGQNNDSENDNGKQ